MHYLSVLLLAVGAAPLVTATATVQNKCPFKIYVQSFPNGQSGGGAGPVNTIVPNAAFSEAQRSSGSAIKVWTDANKSPLTLGYTPSTGDNNLYYDLSNVAGNPFAAYHNTLFTSRASCPTFNCAKNDANCYSGTGANQKTKACAMPLDLTLTVCAP